jgi:hypothetical protein
MRPDITTDPRDAFAGSGSGAGAGDLAALTVHDRCDSAGCCAQAYVRAQLPSGLQLVFCGHHGHALLSDLAGRGAVVRDDTRLLAEKSPFTVIG